MTTKKRYVVVKTVLKEDRTIGHVIADNLRQAEREAIARFGPEARVKIS